MLEKKRIEFVRRYFMSRSQFDNYKVPMEFFLLPSAKRQLYTANYNFIQGNYKKSIFLLSNALVKKPNDFVLCLNLSFILSQAKDKEQNILVWNKMKRLNDKKKLGLNFIRFYCELLLQIQDAKASEHINYYIENYIEKGIKRKLQKGQKPLFTWHIPKCAGTSFNAYVASKYYENGFTNFPSYHTPLLNRNLIEEHVGRFPFVSSAHMESVQFDLDIITKDYNQIVIIRDPIKRAISSWRQYYEDPYLRLNIVLQHGSSWSYWPIANLAEWAKRAPERHRNKITATFSEKMDVNQALANIKNINLIGNIKNIEEFTKNVCSMYSLDFDIEKMPSTLNATKKSITYTRAELEGLKSSIGKDIELYSKL